MSTRPCAWAIVLTIGVGCGSDDPAADDATSATDGTSTGAIETPADPYGPCGDPATPVECDDHPTATCSQRTVAATGTEYAVCTAACLEDGDCPLLAAGNIPPSCAPSSTGDLRCRIVCNLDANSCPTSMICVDGDPPQCMWTAGDGSGHASPAEFCATACGECGATLLLPWTTDCEAACLSDLADCTPDEESAAFACTGGPGCPAGGQSLADCLENVACVAGQ